MYNRRTKVLHLGDVANTGSNLVASARAGGRNWALRDLPAAPSLTSPSAWARRGEDALRYATDGTRPDLTHIHYGPNGYYGSLKRAPYVLHLHGTDLRQDLHRPLIGHAERFAVQHASQLIVATPDLLEAAKNLDENAVYVPNPLPLEMYRRHTDLHGPAQAEVRDGSIFFSARWDDSKGGPELVELARELVSAGHEVIGVDWGTYASEAQDAGVTLLPRMTPVEFEQRLAQSEVVVGQFSFGSLGISDLETLATGRPLVGWVDPRLESGVPAQSVRIEDASAAIEDLLSDPARSTTLGTAGRTWVLEERSPLRTVERLEELYSQVLRYPRSRATSAKNSATFCPMAAMERFSKTH